MDYSTVSKNILSNLGGKENISFVTHCATRLRITVKNDSKVNQEAIKSIDGVLGLVQNGNELQIIIGTDVENVFNSFNQIGDFPTGEMIEDRTAEVNDKKIQQKKESIHSNKNIFSEAFAKFSDFIAASITPALPILVAGGLMNAVLIVATNYFGLSTESGTYIVLSSIYSAAFTLLPIYVGFNVAAKLQISPMLGALLGGILITPSVNNVENLAFLGIPVAQFDYSGSIIPVLMSVILMSFIYKPLEKIIPKEVRFFALPLLTMLITVPVSLIAIAPIGSWIGTVLGQALAWVNQELGGLSVAILGGTFAFMLFTGVGYGLAPIGYAGYIENGYEAFVQSAGLAANLAVAGAAIAIATTLKNKERKGATMSTGLTAMFGITEPAIFGTLAKYNKAFIGAAIGGAVGGLYAGITKVSAYALASPGVASIIGFISPDGSSANLVNAIITMIIGFATGFITTRLLTSIKKQ